MPTRQWADKYGAEWYKHYDGTPPVDDPNDYYWTGTHWAIDYEYMDQTNALREHKAK